MDSGAQNQVRRWLALLVVCVGQLMIVLDSTIVNVALPSIQRDLHFSQADLTWVVNSYLVTYGSLLLLAGRAGDLVGRKKVFLAGVIVFTLASGLDGLAPDAITLIAARALQGIGGAMSAGVIIAILVTAFPRPRPSTGTGSSSSTCPSAWRRLCSAGGSSRTTTASACVRASMCSARCSSPLR